MTGARERFTVLRKPLPPFFLSSYSPLSRTTRPSLGVQRKSSSGSIPKGQARSCEHHRDGVGSRSGYAILERGSTRLQTPRLTCGHAIRPRAWGLDVRQRQRERVAGRIGNRKTRSSGGARDIVGEVR